MDAVVLFGMLEFPVMEDKLRCLKEATRILKKGGELVITTPNRLYLSRTEKPNRLDYDMLNDLLKDGYDIKIYGFNPFPTFPYFLPNAVMEKIPFIWHILLWMMKNDIMVRRCRNFFVIARKRS
jgi:SAM-dependent methyltransferase